MKQILKEDDIVGKTIESNGYGDNAFCLKFTDKTFCIIKGSGWEENDVELSDNLINQTPDSYNADDLAEMGIISKVEAKNIKEKASTDRAEREYEGEYKTYLYLKSKFGKIEYKQDREKTLPADKLELKN